MDKDTELERHKDWAERVFGEGNYKVERRNGEICIDAWNPEAKCIGTIFKKKPKINYFEAVPGGTGKA